MWPAYMSGAAGFEWYVQEDASGHSLDHRLEDYREMRSALNWTGYAIEVLGTLPLLEMSPDHQLARQTESGNTYVLAKPGEVYVLYNDSTGEALRLNLTGVSGTFQVKWFDPRNGGPLQAGTVKSVQAGGECLLGDAPQDRDQDWVCVVTNAKRSSSAQ